MNVLRVVSPAAIAVLAACSAAVTGDSSAGAQGVAVAIMPDRAETAPGTSVQFAAAVTGTAVSGVIWEVVESGGGTVSSTGQYTAPSAVGTFHVRITSQVDARVSAVATVVVTATPTVAVTVSPHTSAVTAGGTVAFTAMVTGASDPSVTWSVREASGCGSVSSAGVYTAPPGAATCHVVATSNADATRSDAATVTVSAPPPPVRVSVSPNPGTVDACRTLAFAATVTGTTNTAVSWSVQEGATGGTITSAGVYTAPATSGTYHVVATSAASSTASVTVPVTVADHVLSVQIDPQSLTVSAGGVAQFTATVTTTCGTVTATQAVVAGN